MLLLRHARGDRPDAPAARNPRRERKGDTPSQPIETLVLCLGNPIVQNDQAGLLVGERIARELPPLFGVVIRQFTGSPLALLGEVEGCSRLILIDSVSTGRDALGSVRLFTEEDLQRSGGDVYPHGMNLGSVFALARRVGIRLPSWIRLIGIEVGAVEEFGEAPEPALAAQMDRIGEEALQIVRKLLGLPAGAPR